MLVSGGGGGGGGVVKAGERESLSLERTVGCPIPPLICRMWRGLDLSQELEGSRKGGGRKAVPCTKSDLPSPSLAAAGRWEELGSRTPSFPEGKQKERHFHLEKCLVFVFIWDLTILITMLRLEIQSSSTFSY